MFIFTFYVNEECGPRCNGRLQLAFLYERSTFNVQRLANLIYSKVV